MPSRVSRGLASGSGSRSRADGRHARIVMRDEIETTMRLLGVTKLSQLGPHLVRRGRFRLDVTFNSFRDLSLAAKHESYRPVVERKASVWSGRGGFHQVEVMVEKLARPSSDPYLQVVATRCMRVIDPRFPTGNNSVIHLGELQ